MSFILSVECCEYKEGALGPQIGFLAEEVRHSHVIAYICIENVTKIPVQFKQVLFESAL